MKKTFKTIHQLSCFVGHPVHALHMVLHLNKRYAFLECLKTAYMYIVDQLYMCPTRYISHCCLTIMFIHKVCSALT